MAVNLNEKSVVSVPANEAKRIDIVVAGKFIPRVLGVKLDDLAHFEMQNSDGPTLQPVLKHYTLSVRRRARTGQVIILGFDPFLAIGQHGKFMQVEHVVIGKRNNRAFNVNVSAELVQGSLLYLYSVWEFISGRREPRDRSNNHPNNVEHQKRKKKPKPTESTFSWCLFHADDCEEWREQSQGW